MCIAQVKTNFVLRQRPMENLYKREPNDLDTSSPIKLTGGLIKIEVREFTQAKRNNR